VSRNLDRLRGFIVDFAELLSKTSDEPLILRDGGALLADLIAHDDWLPDRYARPSADRYQQYLLHCDSAERFSIVAFVWGAGQATPPHNHTVWGLIGLLRGAEISQAFAADRPGVPVGEPRLLRPGDVDMVSPRVGDIHKVANAAPDATSVSIHVYGANIGAVERSRFDAAGRPRLFVSGYANTELPNLWDRSHLTKAAQWA